MVNWIPIVAASLAAIPAAAAFFVAYGRYDGTFQDRVVFLYFIGGMILGGFLGFFALLLLTTIAALIVILLLSILLPIAVTAAVNRRKWQGQRHAVFNGGAAGLGFAVMMGFSILFYKLQGPYNVAFAPLQAAYDALNASEKAAATKPSLDTVPYAFDPTLLGQGALLAIALTGIFFGLGLLAGNGVRLRKQFRLAFLGAAIMFAPMVFLEEYFSPVASGKWTWAALLAAYGLIFGIAAERKLLVEGVDMDDRKKLRRARRKAQAEQ